jgi:hypothetical protein
MGTPPSEWEYGSESKPEAPEGFWIGTDQLFESLGDWAGPLTYAIRAIPLGHVNTAEMCARIPQPDEQLDAGELLEAVAVPFGMFGLVGKLRIAAENAVWDQYCQLKPAPDPILEPTPLPPAYVPPDPPPPDLAPKPVEPLPPGGIDEVLQLIYQTLVAIYEKVDRIDGRVKYIADATTTSYWDAIESFTITGSGTRMHQPADGYMFFLATYPAWIGQSESGRTKFDLGWYGSGGGPFGGRRMERLTRNVQVDYPLGQWSGNLIWELNEGVTYSVSLLRRKPYPDQEFEPPPWYGGG